MAGSGDLEYGIIGTGLMGVEHIRNVGLLEGGHVRAIADPVGRSREAGRAAAEPDVRVYSDYRELLHDPDVDAVVVATPNHTHAAVLDDIFATDKHVLIEKPLCTTLEDCARIRAAAEVHPGVVQVGMAYRYMPPVARLISEVRAGAIGRLVMLAIREHRFPFLPKVGDWNRFNRNTGGTLVEKCCHFFDLMNLIVGRRPSRVFASGAQDVNHLDERYDGAKPDILDNAYVIVEYEGGARALLDLCMFAEASDQEQELDPQLVRAGHHHGATYFEHRAFLAAIARGGEPDVDVRQGVSAVALGVAAQRSIERGAPVELPAGED